jgi:hypothetical protein
MKLKINKLNSLQLKDWRSLCNFARPTHLLRWRTEKRRGRKIIVGAPPCHGCQYEPTQLVEGSALLWISPLTPWDNCKKTKAKKPKTPHYIRQKKEEVDPRSYSVITLYKKIWKIQKYILNVSYVVFSKSMV